MTTLAAASGVERAIHDVLRRAWGFESLRPVQKEVIQAALSHRDAVVVMPTGGGKSLCFQLPAIVEDSLTVVISPLIALMKDQVDSLQVRGIAAAALNSSMSSEEEGSVLLDLQQRSLRVLYVSPERLLLPSTIQILKSANVMRFAIDEAHCISEWGHDFRPEYRQLYRIKEEFPSASVQAFTATATPRVQKDIAIQLRLTKPRLFVGIFDRPNLTYRVVAKDDPIQRIVEAVRRYPDEGIIVYCLSRANTESIAGALNHQDIPAVAYHAGLSSAERKKISEDFANERSNVVVATIAFGMGIDRANVRCVIHDCLPKSMEAYQQETGRAGRDGLPSECVLLYNHGDVIRLKRLLDGGNPQYVEQQLKMLEEVRRFATSTNCRHQSLSEYFGQPYDPGQDGCGSCDVCLGGLRKMEDSTAVAHTILEAVQELQRRTKGFGVVFLVGVLAGSNTEQIRTRGGANSPQYGAFKDQPKARITSWIHQFIDLGFLAVEGSEYPVIGITSAGIQALTEKMEISILENEALLAPAKEKRSKSQTSVENVDEVLFEKFRQWRREIAEQRGVPPYVIFHDVTLMRIAAVRPSTPKALHAIPGMGEAQMRNYGGHIMKLVAQYCADTGTAVDQSLITRPAEPKPAKSTPVKSAYASLFSQGLPIAEVAAMNGVKESTVWEHLAEWAGSGECGSLVPWIPLAVQERVTAALFADGSGLLKPVRDALGEEVEYGVIRAVKNWNKVRELG